MSHPRTSCFNLFDWSNSSEFNPSQKARKHIDFFPFKNGLSLKVYPLLNEANTKDIHDVKIEHFHPSQYPVHKIDWVNLFCEWGDMGHISR